jgi:hypothetical protein
MDWQNYYLANKTNNFTIIYQGYFTQIAMIILYYPYYIIVLDNNNTICQIDIEINQTVFTTNMSLVFGQL